MKSHKKRDPAVEDGKCSIKIFEVQSLFIGRNMFLHVARQCNFFQKPKKYDFMTKRKNAEIFSKKIIKKLNNSFLKMELG